MPVREIAVVSGKGGTGKTTLTAALAELIPESYIADSDVDAANLNLVLGAGSGETEEFYGGRRAEIIKEKCTACDVCREVCEFGAISSEFRVDPYACEGCGACFYLCPEQAVAFEPVVCGNVHTCSYKDGRSVVYAELFPGEENSGKMVTVVRNRIREKAEKAGARFVLIDGPPGIGCPVIASLTGVHFAIICTEPTVSGLHDLKRIHELTGHFGIPAAVVVNKFDINEKYTDKIKEYCISNRIHFLGRIGYDPAVNEAQRNSLSVISHDPGSTASRDIGRIFAILQPVLEAL